MRTITCFGERCIKGMVFWPHECHLVRLPICYQPRRPTLYVIKAEIVSYINFSFLAKFRFLVRENTRICNTENILIHKVIGS